MRQLAILALVLPSLALAQSPAEPVSLRPQWKAGQTSRYHFTTTREQRITMSAQGRTQNATTRIDSEGEVTWRVEQARPDGTFQCTMTLDWMTATLTGPDGSKQGADSRKDSSEVPPLHDLLKAMTGVPLGVTVAADGSITAVSNRSAMVAKAQTKENVPEDLDFIESATDLATLAAAPATSAPGSSWKTNFRWTHDLGHLTHDATFRFVGVEDVEGVPVAVINTTSKPKLELDREQIPAGAPIDIKMSSAQSTGQVLFDLTRHEAVGRTSEESRTFDMTVRLPQGTVTRKTVETVRSQTLRISEE